MGRKRKDASQGLPSRVYLRRGTFFYVHRETGTWENIGRDLEAARRRAEHYNDPSGTYGLMAWFLTQFLIDCAQRVAAGTMAERTHADYSAAIGTTDAPGPLLAYFGRMLPAQIEPSHVSGYLELGAKLGRPTRANRERACLSSCMSWMLRHGHGGIRVNPCMRASGVRRNPERPRERYVTDAEYLATWEAAPAQVRLMMELVYRTLQRPEIDILGWRGSIIRQKADGRVLRFQQGKTGRWVDIAVTGRLAELLDAAMGPNPVITQPIVHTLTGEAYSYSGLSSMLKRAQAKARTAVPALRKMPPFGFRDLKGKGATDMWRAGEPIEVIQMLCGHARKTTTEIYIKARWTATAAPNDLAIGA
jgi:integrase